MTINDEAPWEAVVIGAGLAGVVAAVRLADAGRRVLLVESKRFPRAKTCGGCLNPRAIAGLERAGLRDVLHACEPAQIDRMNLHNNGRRLQTPLPPGLAVTRETLDAALLDEAKRRGVVVREGVRARVAAGVDNGLRTITLSGKDTGPTTCRARLVLACDGLGHPSLVNVAGFTPIVSPDSRIGVGTVIEDHGASDRFPRGVITMAIGRRGYVGAAVCEQGRLNIAAAFDARTARGTERAAAVNQMLTENGLPELPTTDSVVWRGSPRLSQRSARVAGERLLLIGDAAGYVEPFTGEGMAAAVEGANAATPIALRAIDRWSAPLADEWQTAYTKSLRRGQTICRALAWMLKRPLATRIGLAAASLTPMIGRAVAAKVGAG